MMTTSQAAQQAHVSQQTIFHWVAGELVHFAETSDGRVFICSASLMRRLQLSNS
jgi:DNA-binding transcriptional MerR regulator